MNAACTCALAPAIHTELLEYLRRSHSTLSPEEALVRAVKLWLANQTATVTPVRGYQWKSVFLPDGTLVRMAYKDIYHHAEVRGGQLMFRDAAMSPRQMTVAIVGDGRNAWRDLWLRLPGEKNWVRADALRGKIKKQAATQPPSPEAALAAAAKTMSDALSAALTLIEHVDHQTKTMLERRVPRNRREYDLLEDIH